MEASTRWSRCLAGVAALSLMAAITACAAAPKKIPGAYAAEPKKIPGAYETQEAALRSGANISTAVAQSLNNVPDARGATGVVFGNVALIATDLQATGTNPMPSMNNPQAVAGTPNEVGSTPGTLRVEALGTSSQPAGPGTTTATGPQERYTRLAQSLQADYPQIKEVRFVSNMTHAKRLAAIADAMRRGNSIAPYMGELAAIFSDSIPAGMTKVPRSPMPQQVYGIPPGP